MDLSSFFTSLATSFVIFVVLVLIYAWLSRLSANDPIYSPNRILRGLDPNPNGNSRGPFSWMVEAYRSTEGDVIAASGVDSAVYLLFLSTVLSILIVCGIGLLPVLLPLAQTDNAIEIEKAKNPANNTFNGMDKLTMGNITVKSPRLWAFLLATYLVTLTTFYFLWKAYTHVSMLRARSQASPEAKPEQYTILVRDIPPVSEGQTRQEQVDSYFRTLHPDTFYKSMVITNIKEANKIWEEINSLKKKLAHAEAVFAESKTVQKPEGVKPKSRIGFLGLVGKKVDTIDYCNGKIKELIPKLGAEQKITISDKQQASALVFFNSKPAATSAAQTLHAQLIDSWTVMEAPEPRQLIWSNLPITFYERQIRQYLVYGIVFLTVVFYMIPITFVSGITSMKNLRKYLPFMKAIIELPALKIVLEAYLPQLALLIFLALLPKFLMFLSKSEGIPSESHAVRASSGKYFYFSVFNVFLGVTVAGVLFSSMKRIAKEPKSIVDMLGSSLPVLANFFITFVALKFFVGYGLELSRLVPLIIYHLKRRLLCKTEDEIKEAWAPGDFKYATRVPTDFLIMTIVLCYSVIAPLIIPFGALYFALGWIILRNQALKVYVPSYESNGRMWPHMQARIIAALIIYQITMLGYFGLKKFKYTVFVIPLPILSLIFAYVCKKRFYLAFCFTPLEISRQSCKETPNIEHIYEAYIPPCLNPEKFEDAEQFEDARSQSSRTGIV